MIIDIAVLDGLLVMFNDMFFFQIACICNCTGTAKTATNKDRPKRPCPYSISWEWSPVSAGGRGGS